MSFMANAQWGAIPGLTAAQTTYEAAFRWGREGLGLIAGGQIDSSAVDSGNTPTTTLRMGLVLGIKTSSGNFVAYGAGNTDGSQVAVGILLTNLRMTDLDANVQTRIAPILFGGPVKVGSLIGFDSNARGQLYSRFQFDDLLTGTPPNSFGWLRTIAKTANYTVVNDTDNNTIFTTTGAIAEVDFTLPTTIKRGQRWRFVNNVAQTMKIIAPANKFILLNNATATSLAFSTGGQQIGANAEVWVDDTGGFYQAANISAGVAAGTVA